MDHGLNTSFCGLCDAFLAGKGRDDTTKLDSIAKDLALDENLRCVPLIPIAKPLSYKQGTDGYQQPIDMAWPPQGMG